uniref:Uncharacterized protein n=1 Tax=Romanomermis culicivorax TaxID=13658 RepID=A0A915IQI7_ROMCU
MAGHCLSFNCVYFPIAQMASHPSTSMWTASTTPDNRSNPMTTATIFNGQLQLPYAREFQNENLDRDHQLTIQESRPLQQNFYLPTSGQTTHYRVQCNRLFKVIMLASPVYLSGYYTVSREVGRYVYFPCEKKYLLVNYGAVEEYEYHEMAVVRNGFVQIVEKALAISSHQVDEPRLRHLFFTVVEKRVVRQPKIVINYCSHRSHTPSDRFDRVIKREPVREEWPKLKSILSDLQRQTTQLSESCDIEIEETHPTISSRTIIIDNLILANQNLWSNNCDFSRKSCSNIIDRLSNKSKKRRYPEVTTVENEDIPSNGNRVNYWLQ